ncbi:unnamed protein product [Ostreobium quekettii]|uniref:BTB domain-containing protein n=1 Tax=Ostreobium quekettii TaxID=121088 RepID=A0A8S1JCA4_9CHLO|nr:unnamed protein product [Ostreobium quekettii]|eukprot:evm.model.scf_1377.3 EVM.evm.TU.scf_1377.3   scf_1377:12144-13230(+)
MADVWLCVQGQNLPAHGAVLAMHSGWFCKLLRDAKRGEVQHRMVEGKPVIKVDEWMEDVDILLSFMYGVQVKAETVESADKILGIAEKYDMPGLVKVVETRLCAAAEQMSFCTPHSEDAHGGGCKDRWEAAKWLAMAERLDMNDLKTQCQFVILRDIADFVSKPLSAQGQAEKHKTQQAVACLEKHGVSIRSMCEMILAIVDKSRQLVRPAFRCPTCQQLHIRSRNQRCASCDCGTLIETNACRAFVEMKKEAFLKSLACFNGQKSLTTD